MSEPAIPVPEPSIPVRTGGPPYPAYSSDKEKYGLSILDWFAGHALAGLMANTNVVNLTYIDSVPDFINPPASHDTNKPLLVSSRRPIDSTAEDTLNVLGTYIYDYNDPTEPPPMSGRFRLNNAYALASLIWIHEMTKGGVNIEVFLKSLKVYDQILIQIRDNPNIYRRYEVVTLPIDYTTYFEIEIRHMEGSGTIPKLTETTITFFTLTAGAPPITTENMARTAYYAAAWMVQLRTQIPIEPEPVPSEVTETLQAIGRPAVESGQQTFVTVSNAPAP